jgi:hypothetical protein
MLKKFNPQTINNRFRNSQEEPPESSAKSQMARMQKLIADLSDQVAFFTMQPKDKANLQDRM